MSDLPGSDLPGGEPPREPAPTLPPPRPVLKAPPPGMRPPMPVRRSGFPWVLLIVLGVIVLGGCAMTMVIAAAAGGGAAGKRHMNEETVEGEGEAKILLVALEGPIMSTQGGGLFGGATVDPVASVKRQLDQAAKDDAIKAVLLYIDSPGGAVTASDEIHHAVTEFKLKTRKPVVAFMGAICASGGVYVAVAADKIICQPTTITGSIGVILSTLNFHDLAEKYGVKDVTIKSGPNKDLLNSTAPVREEHLKILQVMVDDAYARFVDLVARGRNLDVEKVKEFADGRILIPTDAKKLGLVDEIGYREDALKLVRGLVTPAVTEARLVRYTRPPTLADVLAGNASIPVQTPTMDAAALVDRLGTPRLLAIWRPW